MRIVEGLVQRNRPVEQCDRFLQRFVIRRLQVFPSADVQRQGLGVRRRRRSGAADGASLVAQQVHRQRFGHRGRYRGLHLAEARVVDAARVRIGFRPDLLAGRQVVELHRDAGRVARRDAQHAAQHVTHVG
jgi:hypothetical protein